MIERISVDKNIMHGKPCIRDTRIPVYLILDLLAGGSTIKDILDINIGTLPVFFLDKNH